MLDFNIKTIFSINKGKLYRQNMHKKQDDFDKGDLIYLFL
jgi:hypothetical protein